MNEIEELEKKIKKLERKNALLEQTLLQDSTIRKKYDEAITQIRKKDSALKELNETLEKKVAERTKDLETLYRHEKYLTQILKIIADINTVLLDSFSTQSIIDNIIANLSQNSRYGFIWIGIVRKESLEVYADSVLGKTYLQHKEYNLLANDLPLFVQYAKTALTQNRIVIEELSQKKYKQSRKVDTPLFWAVSIALRNKESAQAMGVLNIYLNDAEGFTPEEINMLANLAYDIGVTLYANHQKSTLEAMKIEKINNYEETILAFVNMIEHRDTYTAGHTLRVAYYCRLIANKMGLAENEIKRLEKAAILHDIGKIATPDSILLKPGKLSNLEYELIKQHAVAGYEMLSQIQMYKDLADIIYYHHSRYDGTGYPPTNNPYEIPLLARIMVVADSFDAMTTNRIYRPRKSKEDTLKEIKALSSIQFDPEIVSYAIEALKESHIDNTSSQLPSNDLERKRFSYFFQDTLTELYNEQYLQIQLINNENPFKYLTFFYLKNFSQYNKQFGWSKGDLVLKEIAQLLKERFEIDSTQLFRYHGDDFVLISRQQPIIDQNVLNTMPLLQEKGLRFQINTLDLSKIEPQSVLSF